MVVEFFGDNLSTPEGFPEGTITDNEASFPGGSEGKESACSAGDMGLIPGLGRSPGGGRGNPLQYFCLFCCQIYNPGTRWAPVLV